MWSLLLLQCDGCFYFSVIVTFTDFSCFSFCFSVMAGAGINFGRRRSPSHSYSDGCSRRPRWKVSAKLFDRPANLRSIPPINFLHVSDGYYGSACLESAVNRVSGWCIIIRGINNSVALRAHDKESYLKNDVTTFSTDITSRLFALIFKP